MTPTASEALGRRGQDADGSTAGESARFESAAIGVERRVALGGAISFFWSLGVLLLVALAVLHLVVLPLWAYVVAFLAPILTALGRRFLRGMSARRAPGTVSIDAQGVAIDSAGMQRRFGFPPEREGWATPLGDGAMVALRVLGGGLVCFRTGASDAEQALVAAEVTPDHPPLSFSLEQPGPWSLWLGWLRRPRWARVAMVTMLLAVLALELAPALYPLAYLVGLALFVGERALLVRDPPRVVVEDGAIRLAALGHRSRVSLERIVSVDATPRGVVLTAADGSEVVLPIASGRPEQRGKVGFWVSEAALRDAQLARQTALVAALRLACPALGKGKDGYREAALRGYARAARLPATKP